MAEPDDKRPAFLDLLARTAPLEPASGVLATDEDPRARRGDLDLDAIERRFAKLHEPCPHCAGSYIPCHDYDEPGCHETGVTVAAIEAQRALEGDARALLAAVKDRDAALARLRDELAKTEAANEHLYRVVDALPRCVQRGCKRPAEYQLRDNGYIEKCAEHAQADSEEVIDASREWMREPWADALAAAKGSL
jgi:hypothetical protein